MSVFVSLIVMSPCGWLVERAPAPLCRGRALIWVSLKKFVRLTAWKFVEASLRHLRGVQSLLLNAPVLPRKVAVHRTAAAGSVLPECVLPLPLAALRVSQLLRLAVAAADLE